MKPTLKKGKGSKAAVRELTNKLVEFGYLPCTMTEFNQAVHMAVVDFRPDTSIQGTNHCSRMASWANSHGGRSNTPRENSPPRENSSSFRR